MKIPSVGTIGGIALLGGLGFIAYKFMKGEWKLPSLLDILGGAGIPTPAPETLKETGIVGGIGDVLYNISTGEGELRERVEKRAIEPLIPFPKAVAEVVSEDIHKQGLIGGVIGFPGASILGMPDPTVTIGAGLGAIAQHEKWKGTLTEEEKAVADWEEAAKRTAFKQTPEGMIGTALTGIFPPLALITTASTIIDIVRVSAPKPKPYVAPYVAPYIPPDPRHPATDPFLGGR